MCIARKKKSGRCPSLTASSGVQSPATEPRPVPIPTAIYPNGTESLHPNATIKNPKKEKKRIEGVMEAIGVKPNTSMVDKMVRLDRKETKDQLEKPGDISFKQMLKNTQEDRPADDDTKLETSREKTKNVKPRYVISAPGSKAKKPYKYGSKQADEEEDMNGLGCPNERNWMYNKREMYYVLHDMLRVLDADNVKEERDTVESPPSPFADQNALLKRRKFGCKELRRNAFLSNVDTMPTDEERNIQQAEQEKRTMSQSSKSRALTFRKVLPLAQVYEEEDRTAMSKEDEGGSRVLPVHPPSTSHLQTPLSAPSSTKHSLAPSHPPAPLPLADTRSLSKEAETTTQSIYSQVTTTVKTPEKEEIHEKRTQTEKRK